MDRYTTTLCGHKNLMFSGIRLEQGWYNQGACSASQVSFCSSPHEFAVSLSQFNIWNLGFLSSKLAEIGGGGGSSFLCFNILGAFQRWFNTPPGSNSIFSTAKQKSPCLQSSGGILRSLAYWAISTHSLLGISRKHVRTVGVQVLHCRRCFFPVNGG